MDDIKKRVAFHKIKSVKCCHIQFHFYFPNNRRRDLDNYSATVKFIIDGLVNSGVIKDDDFKFVQSIVLAYGGKDSESVQVTIEEVE